MKPLLTTKDVAEMLDVDPKTVQNWRYLQVGPPYVKHRGRVYYRASDMTVYLAALPLAA
ncbi:helix-turn-helix domain-containing protein [Arthrobacter sp. NPDC097144]|uniref:helix-turn-helix domain-containing protein n=1 Tax=Arthrobacter sp. NPDC097144 TaxID=3363946 RepID=UPI003806555D